MSLGTLYESNIPTDKAVILVGGSGEKRDFVELRAKALCSEGFHVLALGYYLWKPLSAQTVSIPVDYAEKAVRFLKNYERLEIRWIGMTGLSLSTAYTLLCADGKITRSDAASAGENDDDGSKIPKGVQPCQCGQLDETG